ncbi:MAG: hypothetical protein JJU11_08650, partial [Candidatus Sumerlaeia bacterium]|nr:hypothetical protein [Candidatus Sumerlaeia bacterium]
FAQWLAHKRENDLTMEQIAEQTGCGCGCGSCAPYLGVVAATDRTELQPMSYDEMLRISRGAE